MALNLPVKHKVQKHIHKLRRHKYKTGAIVYFCIDNCNYKIAPALALGKKSICNICGEVFSLTEYSVRLAKPHCDNCHKPKNITTQVAIHMNSDVAPETKQALGSLAERLARSVDKNLVHPNPEEDEEL